MFEKTVLSVKKVYCFSCLFERTISKLFMNDLDRLINFTSLILVFLFAYLKKWVFSFLWTIQAVVHRFFFLNLCILKNSVRSRKGCPSLARACINLTSWQPTTPRLFKSKFLLAVNSRFLSIKMNRSTEPADTL